MYYQIDQDREKRNLIRSKIMKTMFGVVHSYRDIDVNRFLAVHELQMSRSFGDCSRQRVHQQETVMEHLIKNVITENRLLVHYQPIYDLEKREIVGLEALVRFCGEDGNLVYPGSFIKVAEKKNLINTLGRLALGKVCGDINRWKDKGVKTPVVAVNISAYQFVDPQLPNQIEKIVTEHGLPTECIEFEITESGFLPDHTNALNQLKQLRDLGFGLVIDDFGTGYASLRYLSRFPVSKVKMDRCFTAEVLTSPRTSIIVDTIVSLGERLKLEVVAEGIETSEQERELLRKGLRYGQGFLYCRASDRDDIETVLAKEQVDLRGTDAKTPP